MIFYRLLDLWVTACGKQCKEHPAVPVTPIDVLARILA
jgi:hypothetical protein